MATTFLIDGLVPTDDDLRYLAVVNYGAYTSFRVEQGGARGLDLHLARLIANGVELFGHAPDEAELRQQIRAALGHRGEAWLRISLFSPDIWARRPSDRVRPKVMTTVSPAPGPLATRVRLQVQTYVRDAAHIKHTAAFPLIRARRLALDAGFDDALFADADGVISEGSLWNIGFLSGDAIVWPEAPMLSGVAQALISRGLGEMGRVQRSQSVRLADLSAFDGAFLCNSATPACPILAIGDHAFATSNDHIRRIGAAWASNPIQAI